MKGYIPRIVIVTRESDYQLLLARHATRGQAQFFLETRGQEIEDVQNQHNKFDGALKYVAKAIPTDWRKTYVKRHDLDRFLFEPRDTIVIIGQDGLVANVSKYLDGQPVIGINPDPSRYEGVLVPHPPKAISDLLRAVVERRSSTTSRIMVEARLGDGQHLQALNEIFVGAATHQSARYRISYQAREERQYSSGIIVATGTGSSGWARSIQRGRQTKVALPHPEEPRLAFFVREAFPSVFTGADLTEGEIAEDQSLEIASEMNEDGVIFGDGIEADRIEFPYGALTKISISQKRLEMVP